MKKTLLMAAAALAAGIISSQAQPVYSQNIVGYVNTVFPAGFTPVVPPLTNTTGMSASNILVGLANPPEDLSEVYFWNGTTYVKYIVFGGAYYDAGQNPTTPPTLSVGSGVFVNAPNPFTNTFVGTVVGAGGPVGTTVTNTINIKGGYNFVNSLVPIGGGLTTTLHCTPGDLDEIYKWNGAWVKYIFFQGAYYDAGQNPTAEPQIKVGEAIFINAGNPFTWTLVYTNN